MVISTMPAGRPIWPRRFFLCRYEDLRAVGASYRTIWEAVAPVQLPCPDGHPLAVAARPQSLSDLVAMIDARELCSVPGEAAKHARSSRMTGTSKFEPLILCPDCKIEMR